jgi:exonuclease III
MILCGDYNIAHREIDIHNPKGNVRTSGFLPTRAGMDGQVFSRTDGLMRSGLCIPSRIVTVGGAVDFRRCAQKTKDGV